MAGFLPPQPVLCLNPRMENYKSATVILSQTRTFLPLRLLTGILQVDCTHGICGSYFWSLKIFTLILISSLVSSIDPPNHTTPNPIPTPSLLLSTVSGVETRIFPQEPHPLPYYVPPNTGRTTDYPSHIPIFTTSTSMWLTDYTKITNSTEVHSPPPNSLPLSYPPYDVTKKELLSATLSAPSTSPSGFPQRSPQNFLFDKQPG